LQEALTLYYREIADLGLPGTPPLLEVAAISRPPRGLELPLMVLSPVPGWHWAREVWLRSGVGSLGRAWQKLKQRLGWGALDPRQQLLKDLSRALAALKDWLREEVSHQLVDYRERLKFQYFFPLVDQWLKLQESGLEDTLGSLFGSLQGVAEALHLAEAERQERSRRLEEMLPTVQAIESRLAGGRSLEKS
jgi:hypothetical protein